MESPHRSLTYRVEHIPAGTTKLELEEYFHAGDRPFLCVRSLVPAVYNHDLSGKLIATVEFRSREGGNREPRLLDNDLSIDKDFHGLTPLYQPKGPIVADVIAVTGLAGHAFASWAHSSSKMWLRDYLPEDIPDIRVMIYGYESRLQGNTARSIFSDHTTRFINRVKAMRKLAKCQDRPIIFVGHSLGCLIIKKALIEVNGSIYQDVRFPVSSIIFFGAHHKGLQTAALKTLVESGPSEILIDELTRESPTLTELNMRFGEICSRMNILTLFEKRPTKTAVKMSDGHWKREGIPEMMVSPDSAKLFLPNETLEPCNADHSQIAKVTRSEGGSYIAIKVAFVKAIEAQDGPAVASIHLPIRTAHSIGATPSTSSSDRTQRAPTRPTPNRVHGHSSDYSGSKKKDEQSSTVAAGPDPSLQKQLCSAVISGDHEAVQRRLARGGRPHTSPHREVDLRKDPFLLAAWHRQERILAILIKHGADVFKRASWNKASAMHLLFSHIAKQGPIAPSLIQLLLQNGLSLEVRSESGLTPLLLCVVQGLAEDVECLLTLGADIRAVDKDSAGILHMAAYSDAGLSVLKLIISKIPIDTLNRDGQTPLIYSAHKGQIEITRCLLAHGANVHAQCNTKGTPLNYASSSCNSEIVEILLEKGANPFSLSVNGYKPSDYVSKSSGSITAKNRCMKLLQDAEKAWVYRAQTPRSSRVKSNGNYGASITNSVNINICNR